MPALCASKKSFPQCHVLTSTFFSIVISSYIDKWEMQLFSYENCYPASYLGFVSKDEGRMGIE